MLSMRFYVVLKKLLSSGKGNHCRGEHRNAVRDAAQSLLVGREKGKANTWKKIVPFP